MTCPDFKRTKFLLTPFLWLPLFVLLYTGCTPDDEQSCPSPPTPPTAQTDAVSTSDELVVYIDTSASMAGYVSPNGGNRFSSASDGQTIFSKTLLELRNVVNTFSPQLSVLVRHVDANDVPRHPSENNAGLAYPAIHRSLYSGLETNLVGALRSFSSAPKGAPEGSPLPRFHILITDGVQSTEREKTGTDCFGGSDAGCVKNEIRALIARNWHGTVLGVRSEFDGFVYSENAPRSLPADKRKFVYSSGNQDTERFRPFYLYIFSPQKEGIEGLVESLKRGLRERSEKMVIREYGLTTDYTKEKAKVEAVLGESAQAYINIQDDTQREDKRSKFSVTVEPATADSDEAGNLYKRFSLRISPGWSSHAVYAGVKDLTGNLKWELVNCGKDAERGDRRYPDLKIIASDIKNNEDGTIEVPMETSWLANEAGPRKERDYLLIGRLDTETSPAWIGEWSTEDDQRDDTGNRTINLSISLANLWKNKWLESQNVAEIGLHVQ